MSDEQVQTFEQAVNAFYPDAESEPLEAPTEEATSEDAPAEEEVEAEVETESETEGEASTDESQDDDIKEDLTFELEGKDYSLNEINQWQESHDNIKSMQADCTRKWQEAADLRKKADADIALLDDAISKTNDLAAQLEVLVAEDESIDMAELKEDDPDEYIKLNERAQKRKAKLEEIKANNKVSNTSSVDVEAERTQLIEANPHWLEDGKPTEAYKADMEGLNKFYIDNKWTQQQVDLVNSSAKIAQLVLDSVRRKTEDKATDEKKAKARKVIKATKAGKSPVKSKSLSAEERFYGKN